MMEITFIDAAIDDLRKIGPEAVPKVLKKMLLLLESPTAGQPLGGELTGYRKLVIGRNARRIVYRVIDEKAIEICEIRDVGARAEAEVYAEASKRAQRAAGRIPELRKLAGDARTLPAPPREPVPDWLAQRLIRTVGMPREEVAALSLEEAVDRWGEFMSKPR